MLAKDLIIAQRCVTQEMRRRPFPRRRATPLIRRVGTRDPYKPEDARCPLESRMVLSVATTLQHPRRGFIKLEDTVEVTEIGHEVDGDRAHGWNRAASKLSPY